MIPIIDFQRRSLTGPVMKGQEFDTTFAKKVREIVARYPIKYDPERIIADDALADAVFKAGVDLLAEVGIYNMDTQRVIQFTRDEVVQIAKDALNGPRELSFGKGKEEVTMKYRTAEDPRPPVYFMGAPGTLSPEELYIPYVQSFLQEELCQGNSGPPTLPSYKGVENKVGTPGEIFCAIAELKLTQEAARRVGRPDIYIGMTGTATSVGAVMSLFFPGGLERYNGLVTMHMMPEQKLDWTRLVLALWCEERGLMPWISPISILGALCRGPEDAAVTQIASLLGQRGYGHGRHSNIAPISLDGSMSRLENYWAYSAAARAAERNLAIPIAGLSQAVAGLGTEMACYERAAQTVTDVASGAALLWYETCRTGRGENPASGLEGRLRGETSLAVAGMKTAEANELIKKIHAKYADQLSSPPEGKTFGELYDVQKVQPTSEYLDIYKRAKEELARLGVPYK